MKLSQCQKILNLHEGREWVCQNEYREQYIFSPHKRREEIMDHQTRAADKNCIYNFIPRPCAHGYANVVDYKLIILGAEKKSPQKEATDRIYNMTIDNIKLSSRPMYQAEKEKPKEPVSKTANLFA